MENKDQLMRIFSKEIRGLLSSLRISWDQVQELRLRVNTPLSLILTGQEHYITSDGNLSRFSRDGYLVTREAIRETMEHMSNYSLYAFEEEIRQGFLTIQGGHRIGLAGKIIMDQKGIKTMKHISFLNVRLAHQIKGCASTVLPYIYQQGQVLHTLIISPPRCGKTTLLRDLIRQISDGNEINHGMTVGVVDERSELGACYQGIPQNDLGIRTDILDCCPKAEGMMMLIRTMSPQVVAVDEIGGSRDIEAMEYAMSCGCQIVATVHGNSLEDIKKKTAFYQLFKDRCFQRYIVLNSNLSTGNIEGIYNEAGNMIWQKKGAYNGA